MAVQLYDLSCAPKDDKNNLTFTMRAPLSVIANYLKLHNAACTRIVAETKGSLMPCFIYVPQAPDDVYVIWRPVNPLPTTAAR